MPTLLLIKPDAIYHGSMGRWLGWFEPYHVEDMRIVKMDQELCKQHYAEHVQKDFYPGLEDFMCSDRLLAVNLDGHWEDVREMALKLRGMHAELVRGPRNLLHSSDSAFAAMRELDIWFPHRPIRWNPYNKVVQCHRFGTVYNTYTDAVRESKGLPVPWTPEIAEKEVHEKPVF